MTTAEVMAELLVAINAGIHLTMRVPKIDVAKTAVHDMQLAVYWIKSAEQELDSIGETVLVTGTNSNLPVITKLPTLIGTSDYFDFIQNKLNSATRNLTDFKEQTYLPETVKHKLDRSHDRLTESNFNLEIAKMYYGELNRNQTRE